MGCGCGGGSGSVISNTSTSKKNVTLSNCPELQEVLRAIDLRVINLLNIENKPILQETNRQLRMWMRNLNSYCPSQDEIDTVNEFVNKEEEIIKK